MTGLPRIVQNGRKWPLKYIQTHTCFQIRKVLRSSLFSLNEHCFLKTVMASNRYCIDFAKRGTAGCKNCKSKIDKGIVRIGKIIPNPFTESGGDMKQWFHVRCIFETLSRARASTKKIESTDDLEGWDELADEHKPEILKCLAEFSSSPQKHSKATPKKTPKKQLNSPNLTPENVEHSLFRSNESDDCSSTSGSRSTSTKDDLFREFRKLCTKISEEPSYTGKTAIVSEFLSKGLDKDRFKGDLCLWVKMLLPGVNKRVYNLQNKQLVKLFSEIFSTSQEEMLEDLEQGDVAETVRLFFEESTSCPPQKKSTLTLQEVDTFLEELSNVSKEAEQSHILTKIARRCTGNDLKMFIRFIKHDLRINAGPKHILDAIHPNAYAAFQASRNLEDIVTRCARGKLSRNNEVELTIQSTLMTPVLPMLAMACRSVEETFKRFPKGFYVEIKYDGERVQLHKRGNEFSYFSRSLKPVMQHKVLHLKDYIPRAFPHGNNLIIDCEILLVSQDGKPLPFGTLGAHKKTQFHDATVCLFVFDCLQYNDENLMEKPLVQRRKILEENMTEVKNHVMFSEMKDIKDPEELKDIIHSVIQQGLEGIVIKGKMSIYEPGKRHWLKVKKDYLDKDSLKKGVMPDTADLVVLGAYYGTGNKGGMMSIFLMGCYNEMTGKWCTVAKVHSGHDDAMLSRLQTELKMIKISKDTLRVPSWLNVTKTLIPDFVSADPKLSPVWEITGAQFSKSDVHTANGISIRFPRVTRIRNDKTWEEATTVKMLQDLYDISQQTSDVIGLATVKNENDDNEGNNGMDGSTDDSRKSSTGSENSPKGKGGKSAKSPMYKNRKFPAEDHTPVKKAKLDDFLGQKTVETKATPSSGSNKLCDVFSGVKLFIPPTLEDADVLRRYFVAYDGYLLKKYEKDEANLVISYNNHESPKNVEKVSADWLWACIKLQKRLPIKLYKVDS